MRFVRPMSYLFGSHVLHNSQIFYESSLSLGVVNLKPIVPGHVLIIPKRVEPRVMNLTSEEYIDLFLTARIVGPKLEQYYQAEAMNIAIQDGVAAGQSVEHVHIHILPRKRGERLLSIICYHHDHHGGINAHLSQEIFRETMTCTKN